MTRTRLASMFSSREIRTVFVDPGLGGTGICYCEATTFPAQPPLTLVSDVIYSKSGRSWLSRVTDIADELEGIVLAHRPERVVIEYVSIWGSSLNSVTSARRGDLFKLAYLIGALAQVVKRTTGSQPILVDPRDWKGQLTKEATSARAARSYPEISSRGEHERDAIAMAISAQGLL